LSFLININTLCEACSTYNVRNNAYILCCWNWGNSAHLVGIFAEKKLFWNTHTHRQTNTHTHTHTYIYIYLLWHSLLSRNVGQENLVNFNYSWFCTLKKNVQSNFLIYTSDDSIKSTKFCCLYVFVIRNKTSINYRRVNRIKQIKNF
jgi:hypothetical protein